MSVPLFFVLFAFLALRAVPLLRPIVRANPISKPNMAAGGWIAPHPPPSLPPSLLPSIMLSVSLCAYPSLRSQSAPGGPTHGGGGGSGGLVFDDMTQESLTMDLKMDLDMDMAASRLARPSSAAGDSSVGSGLGGGASSGGGGGETGGGSSGGGGGFEEEDSAGAVCELREDVGSVEEVILTHNAFIRKVASEAGIR